jgi:hypothetical protein
MSNLIILAILIAAAILLTWLGLRTWRAKRRFVRWAGAVTASVLVVVLCLISGIAVAGLYKMRLRGAPVPDLKVEANIEQIRRGEAITESFCGACHSRSGTLTGGVDIGKDLSPRLGSFVSSNLTPAGPLKYWSDGEIFRAIRNGVGADGRWLVIMSLTNAGKLSETIPKPSSPIFVTGPPPASQPGTHPTLSTFWVCCCSVRASSRSASRYSPVPSPRRPKGRRCNTANISCPTATATNATALTCTAASPVNSGRSGPTSMS